MTASTQKRRKPIIGIALGAGVARGWAHIGVLQALHKHGVTPDIIAGCSIGSVVGGIYAAGQLDILENWARSLTRLKILGYMDIRLSGGGMLSGDKLVGLMRRYLQNRTIESLDRPFISVATDLLSGHEIWHRNGDLVEAMRASIAMPGIFPPVMMEGRWLVDGAIVNPVPVSACRSLGADLVIAVNLNADLLGQIRSNQGPVPRVAGFDLVPMIEEQTKLGNLSGWRRFLHNPALKMLFQRESPTAPSLFGTMVSSLNVIQDRITRSRLAGEPPDVHIAPRIGHIGLMEFDRAADLIWLGHQAVESALPDLENALASFGCNLTVQPTTGSTL